MTQQGCQGLRISSGGASANDACITYSYKHFFPMMSQHNTRVYLIPLDTPMASPQQLRTPTPRLIKNNLRLSHCHRRRAHSIFAASRRYDNHNRCPPYSRSRLTSRNPTRNSNDTEATRLDQSNACRHLRSHPNLCGVCAMEEPEIPADKDIPETALTASVMVQTSCKLESEKDETPTTASTSLLYEISKGQKLRNVARSSTSLQEWPNRYSQRKWLARSWYDEEGLEKGRRYPTKNAHLPPGNSHGQQLALSGVLTTGLSIFGLLTPPNSPCLRFSMCD
jgi:hypothetical protein